MSQAIKTAQGGAPLIGLMPGAAKLHRLSALMTLLLLIAGFAFASPAFFSVNNGLTVLLQTSVIGLLGIGAVWIDQMRNRR
ncbi:hypothetical protein [Sagittula sp. SSi028]|uniref:hypothetical protein n=1 Tax=Sagittula sp. SSi028 TaxID=3400636 RepID=UPI003AF8C5A3